MKFLKAIGRFLLNTLFWITNILLFLMKKIFRLALYPFNLKNLQNHRIAFALLAAIVTIGFLSQYYFFRKYEIVIIPKDVNAQSPIERTFLGYRKKGTLKEASDPGDGHADVSPSRKRFFRGEIKTLEDKRLILKTTTGKDASISVNEKTGIFPTDKSLAVGQSITVSTHLESDEDVADKIVIRKTSVADPNATD